jgi:hypothetical protein
MQQMDDQAIIDERLAQLRERRSGFPDQRHPFESLAEAIVWSAKVPAETVALELSARARRPMADVMEEEARLESSELDDAQSQGLNLENGLRLAQTHGASELPLDSRDPAEDRLAGALISILVASDYATVRTEDLGNEQYRYHVAVDWPRLDALSARIGLAPVTQLLAESRPI